MIHKVFNPIMSGGGGGRPPLELNPRFFKNENSNHTIFFLGNWKEIFLTLLTPPLSPVLTLFPWKVDPIIWDQIKKSGKG